MRPQPYVSRWVPILTPTLTSSDLEPNFKLMPSPADRSAAALSQTLQGYYARLLEDLGPEGWWPARTRLEVVLGAVLTQSTNCLNAKSRPDYTSIFSPTARSSTVIMRYWCQWEALLQTPGAQCQGCPLQNLLPASEVCDGEPLAARG